MKTSSARSGPAASASAARCLAAAVAATCAIAGRSACADGQIVSWGSAASGASTISIGSLLRYTQVSAGSSHSVALRGDGTVAAWGLNDRGQSSVPPGLSNVAEVAAGGRHSLARLQDGTVRGWGENENGEATVPGDVQVPVAQIAAGAEHSLYLLTDGRVRWSGRNSQGQAPLFGGPVISNATQIAAGARHSVARLADGTVRAWGAGEPGETGSFDFGQSNVPADLPSVTQVAAGIHHTVARLFDGRVRVWGRDNFGQRQVPPEAQGQTAAVAAGGDHALALLQSGVVVAWGRNDVGQSPRPSGIAGALAVSAGDLFTTVLRRDGTILAIGSNASGQCTVPDSRFDIVDLSAGTSHALAVRADGTVVAWGDNSDGKTTVPTGLANVVEVAAGGRHSLAMLQDGTVRGWGENNFGETTPPDGVQGLVAQISAGAEHSLYLLTDGRVRWSGRNSQGQAPLFGGPVLSNATQIAAGARHSVARLADGTVRAWGAGEPGEAGSSDFGQSSVPADIQGIVTQVDAGEGHTVARLSDGRVRAWGRGLEGQVADQPGLNDAVRVAAGGNYTVALRTDGTIRAWGRVDAAQSAPPAGLGEVTEVSVGGSFALALLGPGRSGCENEAGSGTARLTTSGAAWQNVGIWTWTDGGGPQVPGTLSNVTLGQFGSVGSLCDARCATLDVPTSSTLLVPVDLSQPLLGQNPSIDVGGRATLRGRVWLLASGGDQLPDNFSVPVVTAGEIDGAFSVIQSTARAPTGKFATLVPTSGLGGTGWSLAVRGLPGSSPPGQGSSEPVGGAAVAAASIDADGDGFDDLVVAIDNGPNLPGTLQVILNDGAGGLSQPEDENQWIRIDTAPRPTSLAVGRLDADARDDIVVGTASDNAARAYLNASTSGLAGAVQFTPSTQFQVGGPPVSVAIIPASQGQPEPRVAVGRLSPAASNQSAASSISIFSPGSPSPGQTLSAPGGVVSMRGRPRILHGIGANPTTVDGAQDGNWTWALAQGTDGQFSLAAQVPVPGQPAALDVADINDDGFDDVITANLNPDPAAPGTPRPVLTLFLGSAASPIGGPIPIEPAGTSAAAAVDVALVDINDDGVRDIVSVNQVGASAQRQATYIPVNVNADAAEQPPPGMPRPITLGDASPVPDVVDPSRCPRGNVRGPGLEGVFFLAGGDSVAGGGGGQRAVPFRAPPKKGPSCRPDFNDDGAVDGNDLGLLLARWGPAAGDPADLNGDGAVDGIDLGQMLAAWGPCPNS